MSQCAPAIFAQSVRAQMLAAAAAERIEIIDLLPALREAHAKEARDFFWVMDWHLNPDGNRAVATAIETRVGALLRSH